jgi:hypothetical protein
VVVTAEWWRVRRASGRQIMKCTDYMQGGSGEGERSDALWARTGSERHAIVSDMAWEDGGGGAESHADSCRGRKFSVPGGGCAAQAAGRR